MRRNGFTIVEMLVAIGVITVLLSVISVSLRNARAAARVSVSIANIQSNSQAFHLYVNDFSDILPFFTRDLGNGSVISGGGVELGGVRYFDAHGTWPIALADAYFGGSATLPVFRSPRVVNLPNWYLQTDYLYGCSFIASPAFWNTTTRTGPSQFVANRMSSVLFPESKALLSEDPDRLVHAGPALCVVSYIDGSARPTPNSLWKAGYEHGDGSQFMAEGAVHFTAHPWPLHTVDGARGRDLP